MNGLLASIGQFVAYLQMVEAGLNNATVQALYKPLAQKDSNRTGAVLSAANKFYIQSGTIFAALVALLSIIYPLITKEEVPRTLSFVLVLLISLGGLIEFFIGAKYRILLTADQRAYVLNTALIAGTVINTLLAVLIMLNQWSIVLLQACSAAIYFIRVLAIVYYVRKKYATIHFSSEPDRKAIHKRWDAFVHQLSGIVIFNTPVVITTLFCGLKEVSIYMVYSVLLTSIGSIINSFSSSLTPAFGELIALEEKSKLQAVFRNFEAVYFVLITFAFSTVMIMIVPFVALYTDGITDAEYVDPTLALLFIAVGVLHHARIPHSMIITASGHFKETKWRAICEALVHIVASLILVQFLGLYGVLLGSICSYGYRSIDMIIYGNRRVLGQSCRRSAARIVRGMLLGTGIVYIVRFIPLFAESWISWTLTAIGVSLAAFLITAIINAILDREAMTDVYKRIMILSGTLIKKKVKATV